MTTNTILNVGLKIGTTDRLITAGRVLQVAEHLGLRVTKLSIHESNTEPTAVVTIEGRASTATLFIMADSLHQDAIAVLYEGVGNGGLLVGPKEDEWGPFNPDYFLTHSGLTLTEQGAEDDKLLAQLAAPDLKTFADVQVWLLGLKVGDEVEVRGEMGREPARATVERITVTQLVVGGERFRRTGNLAGYRIGDRDSSSTRRWLRPVGSA